MNQSDVLGLICYTAACTLWCPTSFREQTDEYEFLSGTCCSFTVSALLPAAPSSHLLPPPSHWCSSAIFTCKYLGRWVGSWCGQLGNMKLHLHVIWGGTGAQWEMLYWNKKPEEGLDCSPLSLTLQKTYYLSSGRLTFSFLLLLMSCGLILKQKICMLWLPVHLIHLDKTSTVFNTAVLQ